MIRHIRKRAAAVLSVLLLALVLCAASVQATSLGDLLEGLGWTFEDSDDADVKEDEKNSGKAGDSRADASSDRKEEKNTGSGGNSSGSAKPEEKAGNDEKTDEVEQSSDYEILDIEEGEDYDSRDEVCAYLVQFHELPPNFMTKKEARREGWEYGALNQVLEGMSIGGDYFGNYQEVLPVVKGRSYYECDSDTGTARSRGAKRIIYSDDWNIYYTDDHYETFTLLYGDDDYEREFDD